MPDEPTGGGNPNFFKTFKGAYVHAPSTEAMFTSERVMLTCINDVQFQGDCMIMNYTPGATLTTLPPECRPSTEVRVPVVVDTNVDVLSIRRTARFPCMLLPTAWCIWRGCPSI